MEYKVIYGTLKEIYAWNGLLNVEFNKLNASTGTVLVSVSKIISSDQNDSDFYHSFTNCFQHIQVRKFSLSNFIWETQIFECLQFQLLT